MNDNKEPVSPTSAGDVDQAFAAWCKSKGLEPDKCDATNIWIRYAFEGAAALAEPAAPAQPVACGRCKGLGEVTYSGCGFPCPHCEGAQPTPAPAEATRCRYCDGTGDVHSIDGEWRGTCTECAPTTTTTGAPVGGDALHAAIMNLGCMPNRNPAQEPSYCLGYRTGHRDARHAAAELALAATPPQAEPSGPSYGIVDPDYARVFTKARCIAWAEGYALMMHGSFTRDLDILAVPWADAACDPEHLVARIADAADLKPNGHPPGVKPHGRLVWTLLFPAFGDPRFVDISVMPRALAAATEKAEHPDARRQGIEEAAAWVAAKADAFAHDFGAVDPDTGALEFGRGEMAAHRADYHSDLIELSEGIRALAASAPAPGAEGVGK